MRIVFQEETDLNAIILPNEDTGFCGDVGVMIKDNLKVSLELVESC